MKITIAILVLLILTTLYGYYVGPIIAAYFGSLTFLVFGIWWGVRKEDNSSFVLITLYVYGIPGFLFSVWQMGQAGLSIDHGRFIALLLVLSLISIVVALFGTIVRCRFRHRASTSR